MKHSFETRELPPSEEAIKRKRRRTWWIVLGIIFIISLSTSIQTYIQQLADPSPIAGNIVVFSLFNINIILLVVLIILVFRNFIKLYVERKQKVIGHRFRTKLVIVFVLLSLVPSVLLFWVASGFITSSIDNWFNVQIENSLKASLEVAQSYYSGTGERALFYAEDIAVLISQKDMLSLDNRQYLKNTIKRRMQKDRTDGMSILDRDLKPLVKDKSAALLVDIENVYVSENSYEKVLQGEVVTEVSPVGQGDLISAMAPIPNMTAPETIMGIVVVSIYIPKNLVKKMNSITRAFEEYKELKLLKYPIKASYVITFLMITLLILFSATWFGFYLAKGITVPIQELAEATKSIAEGNFDFHVDVKADDEIGMLVTSFNSMTAELRVNKETIEQASADLRRSNSELEQRKSYIETVLENIATGVISIDKQGKISMANKAAGRILNISVAEVTEKSYKEVFDSSHLKSVRGMIRKMQINHRSNVEQQLQIMVSGMMLTLLTNTTVLIDDKGKYIGMVVVFDDLTELIKTQKIAAWREVARGIAHEIKNPLTPIKLNTQRLRKKFFENAEDLSIIFDESTNIIISEVDRLKNLVDEFSQFARMPEPNPKPASLHKVIDDVLLLYKGSSRSIQIDTQYDVTIGMINLDEEQIKRVFINLIDNSFDAVNGEGKIDITTTLNSKNQTVKIHFSDNGSGVPIEMRNKIFLPYVSTKKGGSGLGLAIVNRIIADHDGSIKATGNEPSGTTFIIELPI